MGICCVKQQLTEEDIKFLKKHTRYDEETIRINNYEIFLDSLVKMLQQFPHPSPQSEGWI